MPYIYKITNKINGKIYVGMTYRTIQERWKEHLNDCNRRRNENRPLYNAINKYGAENFVIEVIEETENPEEREKYWIEELGSFKYGYNATLGGDGRPYIDYDLVIATYENIRNIAEVSRIMNIDASTISKILHRNNIDIKNSGQVSKEKTGKPVGMYKDEELLKTFSSLTDAARYLIEQKDSSDSKYNLKGIAAHIGQVCNGKRKTAYGYIWKYI